MKVADLYEPVIGLEVHAQLKTESKMFCACASSFGDSPNTNICPVCTAQPGALPVTNRHAIVLAIRAGLALGCTVNQESQFARKNYFYPDLPKGYQITQHEYPICINGHLGDVTIQRIQIEEDAGKSLHDQGDGEYSLIDLNRCGVPLIEIISGPDIHSPEHASEYLKRLRNILRYLDVCEGNMQEGNFRCDANISIRKKGEDVLGTRTEMKNLNSFKAVEGAIRFEIERQRELLNRGEKVLQQTLLWNDKAGRTEPMRQKEEAHDYRYFPEPDLLPLVIEQSWVDEIKKMLPELPDDRAKRFVSEYQIPEYDSLILTSEKEIADYYEEAVSHYNSPKKISNWVMTELMSELKVSPKNLAGMVRLIDEGVISGKMAKDIFEEMYKSLKSADEIIEAKGLKQISSADELEKIADQIIAENPKQVEQYKKGKDALLGFFVGQLMKKTSGQANPQTANEIFQRKLKICN